MFKASEDYKIIEKGWLLEIKPDEKTKNPLINSNPNIYWALFHKRYNLYNNTDLDSASYDGWSEMLNFIETKYEPKVILPLYMLDHSGLKLSLFDFNDRWDSGQIGFVFFNNEAFDEDLENAKEKIVSYLKSEIQKYEHYLNGDVYCYYLYKDGCLIKSEGNFYGQNFSDNGVREALLENAPETVVINLLNNMINE